MDNAIVVDYGSHTTKAGSASNFPNDKEPSIITPTAVEVAPLGTDLTGDSQTRYPVQKGKIVDFDQFESMLHYLVYDLSGWAYGDEGSIVLVEPLLTPKGDREQLAQLCFEVFNVSGLFFQDSSSLALYAVGKLAGCVVDLGDGKIDVATVSEGNVHSPGVRRLDYSLRDVTSLLQKLLEQSGQPGLSQQQLEQVKALACKAADSEADYAALQSSPPEPQVFKLPDGTDVTIGSEGYTLAEAVLQPSLLGVSSAGILDAMVDSVYAHPDAAFRKLLCENMYVCGGGSAAPHLPQRIARDMRLHMPPTVQPFICPTPEYMPPSTGRFAPWIGGAILAKVVQQQNQYLIKSDYEEAGPYCVHRKCS
jgi:actin-related protein 7, plant